MAAIVRALFLVAACTLVTACSGARASVPNDVRRFLGEDAVSILQHPQRVELYRVRSASIGHGGIPVSATAPTSNRIDDLEVRAVAPKQDADFGRKFGALFLSRDAYLFGFVKACIFQPDTVVRVHGPGGGGWVQFVLCFSCSEFYVATFDEHGKRVHSGADPEDFDGVEDRLKSLIDRAFRAAAGTPPA